MSTEQQESSDFAVTDAFGKPVFMHEWIWVSAHKKHIPDGFRVSHINENTLDNQRHNLALTPCEPGQEYMGDRETTFLAALI